MCLATPSKIVKIKNNKAIIDSGQHTHEVDISLVKGAKLGDYVLVHGDLAINTVPEEEAVRIIKWLNKNYNKSH